MNDPLLFDPLLLGLLLAALAALVLQVSDAIGALVDAATVRESATTDADEASLTRRRGRELFWTFALTATVAVLIAYVVDRSARLAWAPGLGVLALTAVATFVVGSVGGLAVLRRERPTYARLRRDLRDRSTFTVDAGELRDFEERLERADRVRIRRPKAALVLRILGLLLVGVAGALFVLADDRYLPLAIAAAGVHVVAFVVALRAGAVFYTRRDAVLETQRAEVVAMLERARIPQRGSVPGLRDRVSRALAILREKQR